MGIGTVGPRRPSETRRTLEMKSEIGTKHPWPETISRPYTKRAIKCAQIRQLVPRPCTGLLSAETARNPEQLQLRAMVVPPDETMSRWRKDV